MARIVELQRDSNGDVRIVVVELRGGKMEQWPIEKAVMYHKSFERFDNAVLVSRKSGEYFRVREGEEKFGRTLMEEEDNGKDRCKTDKGHSGLAERTAQEGKVGRGSSGGVRQVHEVRPRVGEGTVSGRGDDVQVPGKAGGLEARAAEFGRFAACDPICNLIECRAVSAEFFKKAFAEERKYVEKKCFVDSKPMSELAKCKCLAFDNGKGFVAVAKDGDIVSLMRSSRCDKRHFSLTALSYAIQAGGEKLDCYATYGWGLADLYCSLGFIPVVRVRFDRQYAPRGWKDYYGCPDIVFLFYCGDDLADLQANYISRSYPEYPNYDYVPYVDVFRAWRISSEAKDDYSFAKLIRDTVLEKWKSKYNKAYRGRLTEFVRSVLKYKEG